MRTLNVKPKQSGGVRRRRRKSSRPWPLGPLSTMWRRAALARVPAWPGHLLVISVIAAGGFYGLVSAGYIDVTAPDLSIVGEQAGRAAGLTIKRISVRGHKMARPDEVMRALGAKRGQPILSFDTGRARARLERLGWIASADVARLLPDEIRVTITERTPFALWQLHSRVRVIDKDGVVLPRLRIRDHLNLPLVVGEGAASRAAALYRLLDRHKTLRDLVHAAVRVADRRWNLRLDNGLDIKLPEGPLEEVLGRLVRYDKMYQVLTRDLVALDLRLPDRITVRLSNARTAAGVSKMSENATVSSGE